MCKECDGNIIGKYDKYAIEVIRDKRYIYKEEYSNCLTWDNLDYDKFKLFHLSILWRVDLSEKNARGVNLSKEQSNEIREYILSGKAPDSYNYPICGLYLIDPKNNYENCNEIVTYENKYELLNIYDSEVYVFIYGGIAWNYRVFNVEDNDFLKRVSLKESGKILLQKENIRTYKPFHDIYDSVIMAENYKK